MDEPHEADPVRLASGGQASPITGGGQSTGTNHEDTQF